VLNEIAWEAGRSPMGPVFPTLFLEFLEQLSPRLMEQFDDMIEQLRLRCGLSSLKLKCTFSGTGKEGPSKNLLMYPVIAVYNRGTPI